MRLRSFDGGFECTSAVIAAAAARPLPSDPSTQRIARGAGLSYAAASFDIRSVTVEHTARDRVLGFDTQSGEIEVEAGIRLGRVYEYLRARGRYLPVQPGHPRITVGGCVAADVHGKHQARDGTFRAWVAGLELFHPDHGALSLASGDPLWDLTCGGLGLTGEIDSVRLRTRALPAEHVRLTTTRVDRIADLPAALASAAERAELLYSWHDFTARGDDFGRGFVVSGSFEPGDPATTPRRAATATDFGRLSAERRGRTWPSCFGRLTCRPFNATFRRMSLRRPTRRIALYDFLFPVHDKEAYFHLFGRQGFHEQQLLVPFAGFAQFVAGVRAAIDATGVPITLASGKWFAGERGLLGFRGAGIAFALDFPRSPRGAAFAARIDELTLELGALPNLIKDSRLGADCARRAYGEQHAAFRARLDEFDPRRRHASELSRRLQL